MATLKKTTSVYELEYSNGMYWYTVRDEATGEILKEIYIGPDVFKDLGQPKQITVTIEPGDKLNKPESSFQKLNDYMEDRWYGIV